MTVDFSVLMRIFALRIAAPLHLELVPWRSLQLLCTWIVHFNFCGYNNSVCCLFEIMFLKFGR